MSAPILPEKRAAYVADLEGALERLVADLSALEEVERVILFGSYAAGRRDLLTDLDILVVMRSDLDFVTRTAQLYARLHPGVDLDLFVYTPQEYVQMRSRRFLRHALRNSMVLYEKR